MKKNVYSLVLSEDVVHEIDKLAYQRGTNRSNMVNQILAEYASLITPEKRMSHLLAEVRRHFESAAGFQLPEAASAGMMNLRTALRYKYNPTVRYSLELSRDNQSIGTLRVSLRTQNTQLIMAMVNFYGLWDTVETVFPGTAAKPGGWRTLSPGFDAAKPRPPKPAAGQRSSRRAHRRLYCHFRCSPQAVFFGTGAGFPRNKSEDRTAVPGIL